jgi:CheY-like chemotaxis protein
MSRILVVDDEKTIRELLSKIIEKMGHEVILASDGREGLYSFVSNSIDLVVTDFDMPIMNGWSLAHNIKQRSPDTPVVLATGSDTYNKGEKIKDNIYDSVILKPFHSKEIKESIHKLLPDLINHSPMHTGKRCAKGALGYE